MSPYTSSRASLPRGDSFPVVIVGAGPAGLAAGITLAHYGVECLIVDRRTEPEAHPRATVVSVRNMELLRSWGLEEEVRRGGDDVEWRLLVCSTLAEAARGQVIDIGYPTKEQSAVLSPTSTACIPQDHLESVMLRHLATFPTAHVDLGVSVADLRPDTDSVELVLRDRASGTRRTVTARYVIGADGARSVVRQRVGIPVRARDHLEEALSVVLHAPLWDLVGTHRYGIYFVDHPTAAGTFLPAGQGDRWLYGFEWDPTHERIDDYTPDRLVQRIRSASGRSDLAVRLERVGSFSFAGAMAERFREGPVFIVGDAAHRVTPRGGTGMNTAIADGFDLGWKLGWVVNGWAPQSLLDTYEAERRPVAEHNLARSLDPGGSRRPTLSELHVDLGGRIGHEWLPQTPDLSTIDVLGPGLTLLSGPTGPAAADWPAALVPFPEVPVTTRVLDGITARSVGVGPAGGMLVRPDGVPVAAWNGAEMGGRAAATDDAAAALDSAA